MALFNIILTIFDLGIKLFLCSSGNNIFLGRHAFWRKQLFIKFTRCKYVIFKRRNKYQHHPLVNSCWTNVSRQNLMRVMTKIDICGSYRKTVLCLAHSPHNSFDLHLKILANCNIPCYLFKNPHTSLAMINNNKKMVNMVKDVLFTKTIK